MCVCVCVSGVCAASAGEEGVPPETETTDAAASCWCELTEQQLHDAFRKLRKSQFSCKNSAVCVCVRVCVCVCVFRPGAVVPAGV